MLGSDAITMFEHNKEETESIPEKQTSPKHRDAMGQTNNQQMNVKLELENGNVGDGKTTINFSIIIKEKEEDICSPGIHLDIHFDSP